ncbi:MAG: glycosyltransferase family 4 protein [Prevotella sp.]|nr:glycosyltransferase family 4 protein [Prevotella sp.]
MKIFFLTAYLGAGGAERVVSLLANKMSQMGHDIGVVCLKYNDVFYQIEPNVQLVFPMDHCNNRLSELFWLRRFLKGQKPDVVIPFTEGVYCFTILSLLGTGIPIIASERLDPAAMSPTRKLLKKLLLPYADWLVVQTQSIKEYFSKKIQKKTSIIYNPVVTEVFREIDNGQLKIENEGKLNRIISVGRLYPQKNQEMMIRAFAKVAEEFPDWQLVIYGEGPLRAELEFLVSSFKLQERVLLPGRTEHVIEELRKSKIFCMSSDYEGMSNSMIEAICVGLPIISTKVSGTEDLIRDEENGLLVEIGEESCMGDCMSKLMSSAVLREDMSIRNKKLAGLFDIDFIVNQWTELIKKVKNESAN